MRWWDQEVGVWVFGSEKGQEVVGWGKVKQGESSRKVFITIIPEFCWL